MALCLTDEGPDRDGYGSLACDHPGCKRRYAPDRGASDHETLQLDANKVGWDCYVSGPYERVDLCPRHRRRCVALTPISRRHASAGLFDLPCGAKMREVVNDKPLCGTHARSAKRKL